MMRRQIDDEIVLCCEELGSMDCAHLLQAAGGASSGGVAMLEPLMNFISKSDLNFLVKGIIIGVVKPMQSLDYTDNDAVWKKTKQILRTYMNPTITSRLNPELQGLVQKIKEKTDVYVNTRSPTSVDTVALLHDVGAILSSSKILKYPKLPELGRILSEIQLPTQ